MEPFGVYKLDFSLEVLGKKDHIAPNTFEDLVSSLFPRSIALLQTAVKSKPSSPVWTHCFALSRGHITQYNCSCTGSKSQDIVSIIYYRSLLTPRQQQCKPSCLFLHIIPKSQVVSFHFKMPPMHETHITTAPSLGPQSFLWPPLPYIAKHLQITFCTRYLYFVISYSFGVKIHIY